MSAYSVIVADPPWAPRDKLPGRGRGAAKNYNTLSAAEIATFLVANHIAVAPDAILFLWRLASMQREALLVAEAWGFEVKSEVVWRKTTSGGRPHFGMGRYVRNGHETCLIATRGRATKMVTSHSVRSVFEAQTPVDRCGRAVHSAKPRAFFDHVVEPLVGRPSPLLPCIELFARVRRDGWDAIGDQLPAKEAA